MLGVVIFLLMMATAFMGYVLPWGQMSFWGATVITNLFSAIPLVGESIVTWLWGGFSVDNPTLNRFFSLHYLLPFVIFGVVFLHVAALHITGSNNPLGIDPKGPQDTLPFHPYYTVKDSVGIVVYFIVFAVLVFFAPNLLGHPDNYIPANPLVTPPHIVPEWYFLPYYAILRAVPDKLGGVVLMVASIAILFVLPWLDTSPVRSMRFRPFARIALLLWSVSFFVLMYCGAKPPEEPFVTIARVATLYYFAYFLVILPALGGKERTLPLPTSIIHAGAARRRTAAGGRHGQADGEGVMAGFSLRLRRAALVAGGLLAPRRRRRPPSGRGGRRGGASARHQILLRRAVRHLRPRLGAAGLPGLQGGLRELPLDAAALLPQPAGARPVGPRGAVHRRHRAGHRRAERRRPDVRAAGAALRPLPQPLHQ